MSISKDVTTKDAGPMDEPWTMLAVISIRLEDCP